MAVDQILCGWMNGRGDGSGALQVTNRTWKYRGIMLSAYAANVRRLQ